MARSVGFRFAESASDEQRRQIVEELHERFGVSLGGGSGMAGVLPLEAHREEEIAEYLRSVEGVDPGSIKIE